MTYYIVSQYCILRENDENSREKTLSKLFLLPSLLLLLVSAPFSSSSSQKGSTLKGKHLLPAHFPVLVDTFSAGAGEQTGSHKVVSVKYGENLPIIPIHLN